MKTPLCFVLMPFGLKPSVGGLCVNFDAIYRELIAPAATEAGLLPLRADEEQAGGIIHKPMYERLILCDYAIADLTTANANVFYELGLRHAVKPHSTILLFAKDTGQLPFDVGPLRAIPYTLSAGGTPADIERVKPLIAARLRAAREAQTDSPVYQLVDGFPDIQRLKTDVFRERVQYSETVKSRLRDARKQDLEAVRAVERELGVIADADAGVVIDLLLSYRAVKGWTEMIELVPKMFPPLAESVLVREQLGLALNRAGRSAEAERVLQELIQQRGPSSETYALLGRVYKDRWEAAQRSGEQLRAQGELKLAIDAYLAGFEADWRDAYPGINAVTLMELAEPPDPRRTRLLPVVAYAMERRIASGQPDYWDHATRLELGVLAKDETAARAGIVAALASIRESWEAETTARNLRLIRVARARRGEEVAWALPMENELARRGQQ